MCARPIKVTYNLLVGKEVLQTGEGKQEENTNDIYVKKTEFVTEEE